MIGLGGLVSFGIDDFGGDSAVSNRAVDLNRQQDWKEHGAWAQRTSMPARGNSIAIDF
jgi:hypothetical protein